MNTIFENSYGIDSIIDSEKHKWDKTSSNGVREKVKRDNKTHQESEVHKCVTIRGRIIFIQCSVCFVFSLEKDNNTHPRPAIMIHNSVLLFIKD